MILDGECGGGGGDGGVSLEFNSGNDNFSKQYSVHEKEMLYRGP